MQCTKLQCYFFIFSVIWCTVPQSRTEINGLALSIKMQQTFIQKVRISFFCFFLLFQWILKWFEKIKLDNFISWLWLPFSYFVGHTKCFWTFRTSRSQRIFMTNNPFLCVSLKNYFYTNLKYVSQFCSIHYLPRKKLLFIVSWGMNRTRDIIKTILV